MTSSINIVVIDYQSGNLRSVAKALEATGVSPRVSGDPADLSAADAVVLPGVGSGPAAMAALGERNLVKPLRQYASSGRPFLGVCLGLQLLLDATEEGTALDLSCSAPKGVEARYASPLPSPRETRCLGIVPGRVRRLPAGLKVPHMGWNSVEFQKHHPVFQGIPRGSYFYFVHSYYAAPTSPDGVEGVTEYGIPFCSVYARGNLVATQFHPEKSGSIGLQVYRNFVNLAVSNQQSAVSSP